MDIDWPLQQPIDALHCHCYALQLAAQASTSWPVAAWLLVLRYCYIETTENQKIQEDISRWNLESPNQ